MPRIVMKSGTSALSITTTDGREVGNQILYACVWCGQEFTTKEGWSIHSARWCKTEEALQWRKQRQAGSANSSFAHGNKRQRNARNRIGVARFGAPKHAPTQEPAPAQEPAQAPAQEPAPEPAQEPAQESAQDTAQDPAQSPTTAPSREPAQAQVQAQGQESVADAYTHAHQAKAQSLGWFTC